MKYREQLWARWEKQVPALDGEWTHWWLEGDGGVLLVTDDLQELLEKVEENYEKNLRQIVFRARQDGEGNAVAEDGTRHVISDLPKDAACGWLRE